MAEKWLIYCLPDSYFSLKNMNRFFYVPSIFPLLTDLIILSVSIFITLLVAPLVNEYPFIKYFYINLIYSIVWVTSSFFTGRYRTLRQTNYARASMRLTQTALITCIILGFFFFSPLNTGYSIWVIISYTLLNFLLTTIVYILSFGIGNAIEYKEPEIKAKRQEHKEMPPTQIEREVLDPISIKALKDTIVEHSGDEVLEYLSKYLDFNSNGTLVNFTSDFFELKSKPDNKYKSFALLKSLNHVRGINRVLSLTNLKLPVNGIVIVNFEKISTRKNRIMTKFPPIINKIVYFFDYLFRRVIPKLNLTNKVYFSITKGKDRVLSDTEVLGRLIYCGFDIHKTENIGDQTWVVAKKNKTVPGILDSIRYGPFIKLNRVGHNGKLIHVYKMRTMYSYSEYLQAYIFQQNNLEQGGKFKNDTRLNVAGKWMRKYWIDEIPMLINLFRGDLKLVGVRPLSQHYYSLYSTELQVKRINFKPGLLPPFYADLPKTLEEIEISEMRYITSCEQKGILKTDIIYFFKILKNIFLKKARSA